MKSLQQDLEFGASLEHVHSLFAGLGELEQCETPVGGLLSDADAVPVGRFRGWIVSLYEAAPGRTLPDYATRRALHAERKTDPACCLIVFTDAAHSTFVWTWRARGATGHDQYTEYNATTRRRQLRVALAALPRAGALPVRADEYDDLVIDRLFGMIVPPRERTHVGEADRLQAILVRIERFRDPDDVRTVWRRMRGFSVLHDGCSDGGRLVRAGGAIEVVLLGVIERMQSFVDDASIRRDRRRPEHLRDLRSLTEAAEAPVWKLDRKLYLRRLIVQQNLFAVVSSRCAGRAVLRDLLAYAGAEGPGLPLIDCNIWRRKDRDSWTGERVPVRSGVAKPDVTGFAEELALHRKAWEMVRKIRLAGGEPRDLRGASCQLQRRRQLLLRQLREMADHGTRHDVAEELAFCRLTSGRAFSAVFEDLRPG
jgi:hypothetical protein